MPDLIFVCILHAKVITIELDILHKILMSGSASYKRYVQNQSKILDWNKVNACGCGPILNNLKGSFLNIMEIIDSNSALSKFSAVQKRHLESLAEYPVCFAPQESLWNMGDSVERAYIIIEGTAFFRKRRNSSLDGAHIESMKASITSSSSRDQTLERYARRESIYARYRNRLTIATGVVFTKGHFLGDVSSMVAGLLLPAYVDNNLCDGDVVDSLDGIWIGDEQRKDSMQLHNSTLVAGDRGCVALLFPKSRLIPFFDEYPGLLLSLLGTQAVL
jgi:hypothetical protein